MSMLTLNRYYYGTDTITRREHRVECRLTDEEYGLLQRLSKAEGRSMSAMLRVAMIAYARNLDARKDERCYATY